MPPQPMIGSLSRHDQLWLGIRSDQWKCIKSYERGAGFTDTEIYNLVSDPDETEPVPESELPEALSDSLASFIDRPSIQTEISENRGGMKDVDPTIERRLQELGYKE